MSLPVKRKGDNSKTNGVNSIYLYFCKRLCEANPTVPNMTVFDEVENYDEVIFGFR